MKMKSSGKIMLKRKEENLIVIIAEYLIFGVLMQE